MAEALPLTSRVELNNKEESKCPINRGVLINFLWLIRPWVGYHLNHYSPDVLWFFFVFALISNLFSWRQLNTKTETEHCSFAERLVLFLVFNSIISRFEWSFKNETERPINRDRWNLFLVFFLGLRLLQPTLHALIICDGVAWRTIVSLKLSWTLRRKETGNVYRLFCSVSVFRYDLKPLIPHIAPILTMFSVKPEALFW